MSPPVGVLSTAGENVAMAVRDAVVPRAGVASPLATCLATHREWLRPHHHQTLYARIIAMSLRHINQAHQFVSNSQRISFQW